MRVGEKLIYLLLNHISEMYPAAKKQKKILDDVEKWVSLTLSGVRCTLEENEEEVDMSKMEYGDLKYHISREGKDVNQIRVSRYRIRKLFAKYEELIDLVFHGNKKRDQMLMKASFKDLFAKFIASIDEMQRKQDFTDAEIDQAQVVFDSFASKFVEMFGTTTVTNYVQIIGDGTLRFFLKKYRNLYRWSQQGAEAGVKICRCYSLHRTNHRVGQQVFAFKKFMLRKAIRVVAELVCSNLDGKLEFLNEIYKQGKIIYNGKNYTSTSWGGRRPGTGRKGPPVMVTASDHAATFEIDDDFEEEDEHVPRDEFAHLLINSGFLSGGDASSSMSAAAASSSGSGGDSSSIVGGACLRLFVENGGYDDDDDDDDGL